MTGNRFRMHTLLSALFLASAGLALPATSYGTTASSVTLPPTSVAVSPLGDNALPQVFATPLIATGVRNPVEDAALRQALLTWRTQAEKGNPGDLTALDAFLVKYPESVWRFTLQANLGLLYYHQGYISRAITAWEDAWTRGKDQNQPELTAIADHTLGELVRLHARLGHADRLEALLAETSTRPVGGSATEYIASAKAGLWQMRTNPGEAYLCGPVALKNILLLGKEAPVAASILASTDPQALSLIDAVRAPANGTSLNDIAALARQTGIALKAAYRTNPREDIPLPAVVHWNTDHYATLLDKKDGYYLLKDPAFETRTWISAAALNAESSGYFLIPETTTGSDTPSGWRTITSDEGEQVRGTGYTLDSELDPYTPCDETSGGDAGSGSSGMARVCAHSMLVSLNIKDTPVGYKPALGPAAKVTFTYNQRESLQPAVFNYSNLGPKWTFNWITYIQDNPASAGNSVKRYVAGGGGINYSGYNAATSSFSPERLNGALLVRVSSNPIRYERRLSDGSVEVYAQSDNAVAYPRKVFLTKIIDPAKNTLTLNYDASLRLITLTDAVGRTTRFTYSLADKPYLVTGVTDGVGRSAQLDYDEQGRLIRITDPVGMASNFTYAAGNFINSMTTPYGTHHFAYGESGTTRGITLTDPNGATERIEYRQQAPGIPYSESRVPSGTTQLSNYYINGRNTFYWDKTAYALHPNDYTKAVITHWAHATNMNITSGTLESRKSPLEERVWYTYLGQSQGYVDNGSQTQPSATARVLPDGSTQLNRYTYNEQGKLTRKIDPMGRETLYDYAANGMDLLQVRQKTATGYDTLQQITWNSQHRPLTVKGADGWATKFSYNAAGQLISRTNPLNQTEKYTYDAAGRLIEVTNPLNRVSARYTYDAWDNLASETDSEGYTLTHQYDALDRRTKTTYPDGTTAEYTWDKLDLAKRKDRNGKITTYQYDGARNLIAITDALKTITLSRAPNGLLTAMTDGEGHTTTWDYDIQGRVIRKTNPDGAQTSYSYDSAGRNITRTDALGQVRTATYAKDDALLGYTYSNTVNPTPAVSFIRDAYYPRITAMTDGTGTTTYTYMQADTPGSLQLQAKDGPNSNDIVIFGYDALGRRHNWTMGTASEGLSFDALGRVTTVKNSALGSFKYTYLGDTRQRASAQLSGTPIRRTYAYETNQGDRRLAGITHTTGARAYTYTTAPENLITGLTETAPGENNEWVYGYDLIDRLRSADRSDGLQYDYLLDKADNIQTVIDPVGTRNYTHDTANKIDQSPYRYDANGNLVEDEKHTYTWDAENRLIGIGYKNQPQRSTEMRYDGESRRVAIIEIDGATRKETRYTWCEDRICQARDENDQPIAFFFDEGEYWPTPGVPIFPFVGQKLFYARDHLGSVRDLFDHAGNVTARFDYDPYGGWLTLPETTPQFGYAGMFYHSPSGLYLTHYRGYDPKTARWLSRDPIEEQGGINLYAYVEGNPVSYADPTGLQAAEALRDLGPVISLGGGSTAGLVSSLGSAAGVVGAGIAVGAGSYYLTDTYVNPWLQPVIADVIEWCLSNSNEKERECDAQLERDEAECLVARAGWGKRGQAICLAKAKERYAQCLRGR